MSRHFVACKNTVHNRGVAPDSFLNEIIDWAIDAPDEIFARNAHHDIYSNIVADLGPWREESWEGSKAAGIGWRMLIRPILTQTNHAQWKQASFSVPATRCRLILH